MSNQAGNNLFYGIQNVSLVDRKCYLHRIFPYGDYTDKFDDLINSRVFLPRRDCKPFYISFPVDWEATAHMKDRNWRMQLQGWSVFHPIMNFFDEFDDKRKVLNYFFEFANDWWNSYGNDLNDITTSRMPESYAWYDMSVGFRALVIGFFVNRIQYFNLEISQDEKELVEKLISKHIANLSAEKTFSLNNHGMFQIQGLMCLLNCYGSNLYSLEKLYAFKKMEELIQAQFDENGIHLEHSPHYHFFALSTFESLYASGWYDENKSIKKLLVLATERLKWLVDPKKRPICVGDSILTVQKKVVFPESDNKYEISDFKSSGYSVVRSSWSTAPHESSMLFMNGAYHSKAHKHRDCLTFDWFDNGERIICDSGKYGYRSDKYRNYFLSSRAHNTVEIDGFDILKIKSYGSILSEVEEVDDGVFKLSGFLNYPAIKHKRDLYFKPGSWVVILDDLEFVRARKFKQWLHLNKDYRLVSSSGNNLLFVGENNRTLFVDCLNSELESSIHCGDEGQMQGFLCEKDLVFMPSVALGFEGFGKAKKIVTVLSLGDKGREEGKHFASFFFEKKKRPIIKDAVINIQRLLPNIPHYIEDDYQKIKLVPGKSTNSTIVDNVRINFFSDIKSSNKLLVMLPGASSRARGHIDFQRHSWSDDFSNFDVLSFTDPSLKEENDISIAWFQHTVESFGITALSKLISSFVESKKYLMENIIFFGSSGGGFTSLKLANDFPRTLIISINPQIYLYNYSKIHFDKMLQTCYAGLDYSEVINKYKNRLEVDIDYTKRIAPIYIYQNIHDTKHLNKHLKPYINKNPSIYCSESDIDESLGKPNALNVIYYDDLDSGHKPPSSDKTLCMIKSVTSKLSF
ncbi:alginate lyase family protein [Neptunomonas japonica]|uniref:alginate lyase family protein n=1 Tax=Neptunomonas japonica TaxID=417574 RepID=UPI0004906767|nr:alginate lyase family protein [Neptunomonas japonica]